MPLALQSADGTQQLISSPTLAGLLDALAALQDRDAERVLGCYVLDGWAGELEVLVCDPALAIVLRHAVGEPDYEGEDLVCLGVRLADP